MLDRSQNGKRSLRGVHLRYSSRGFPKQREPTTTFDYIAQIVLPGPELNARLERLFERRVPRHMIRDWRRGKTKAPQWAFDRLEAEWTRQLDRLEAGRHWFARAKKEAAETAP